MSDVWWNPREIIFSKEQILFLIPYFEERLYPPEPSSSYVDIPIGKKQPKSHAPFETPAQIFGELDVRLKRAGIAGKLLVAEVCAEYMLLSPEAQSALNYISGFKRRRQSFINWKKQRTYRR